MGRSPFQGDSQQNGGHRNIPILPSTTKPMDHMQGDPMDLTPPTTAMGPPVHSSPEMEHQGGANGTYGDPGSGHGGPTANGLSAAAATSSQQHKVVQTAFIHKLYKYANGDLLHVSYADTISVCWKIPVSLI